MGQNETKCAKFRGNPLFQGYVQNKQTNNLTLAVNSASDLFIYFFFFYSSFIKDRRLACSVIHFCLGYTHFAVIMLAHTFWTVYGQSHYRFKTLQNSTKSAFALYPFMEFNNCTFFSSCKAQTTLSFSLSLCLRLYILIMVFYITERERWKYNTVQYCPLRTARQNQQPDSISPSQLFSDLPRSHVFIREAILRNSHRIPPFC